MKYEQETEKNGETRGGKSSCKRSLTCSQCGEQEDNYFTQAPLSKDQKAHICKKCQVKNGPPGFSQMNQDRGTRMAGSKRPRDVPPRKRGKVKYLPLENVMKLESERAKPSAASIFSSRPRQIIPSASTLSPKGTSKKPEYSRLSSPVKVNRSSYQETSGPPKASRDGSGLKSHQQAKQLLEDRRDKMALVQEATGHARRELRIEADPSVSVDAGAFGSSCKGKSVDKGKSLDIVSPKPTPSGYLHKRKSSYPVDSLPTLEPGTADAAPAPEVPDLVGDLPCLSLDASWIGKFRLSGDPNLHEYYGAFKAHPALRPHRIAYEFSGFIPEDLTAELIPERQLLVDCKMTSPELSDIGLYIFPDPESESALEDYSSLCWLMKDQGYAVRASMDDHVELLIFTSKHLPFDTQWLKDHTFLWGVYREVNRIPAPRNLSDEISTRVPSPENPNMVGLLDKKDDNEAARPQDDKTEAKTSSEWTPPCTGWVKLNTSAISRGSMTGVGGSVHGPSGKWLTGYVFNAGRSGWTQLRADLWALLHGLQLVCERGYKKVQVETDSEQAPECLKKTPDESDPNADFMKACRELLLGDWQISLSHVSRERNRPAVLMANLFEQHDMASLTVVDSPPPELAESTENSQAV